jgi:HlyD family secretion protein
MPPVAKRLLWAGLALAVITVGFGLWWWLRPESLGEGFVSGNGRIEAVEIDVAAKIAGRVAAVFADEGDFVQVGQVIAEMDASVLTAQRQEAMARLDQAKSAVETAKSQVSLRLSEGGAARAVVVQRAAEWQLAGKRVARSETLALEGATSIQELDDDRARVESASAAIAAARAQVAASDAAVETARSQELGSRASVLAVAATVDRLTADIDDLTLRAPRDGRVQYRVAEVGEVVSAGGKVLNMIDVSDVYLTFFVAETVAGRVKIGSEVHVLLDAAPQYVIPATVTYVATTAQFTPKTVETASERQKLMFRVRANIDRQLLQKHRTLVKTGLPGVAWLKLDPEAPWPPALQIKVPK